MENENFKEELRTVKQEKLITELLQSRVFSKKEFEVYMYAFHHSLKGKYNASLFINNLLSEVRYRKKFRNNRQKARLKCAYCGSRKHPIRRYSIKYDSQNIICEKCEDKFANVKVEMDDLSKKDLDKVEDEFTNSEEQRFKTSVPSCQTYN